MIRVVRNADLVIRKENFGVRVVVSGGEAVLELPETLYVFATTCDCRDVAMMLASIEAFPTSYAQLLNWTRDEIQVARRGLLDVVRDLVPSYSDESHERPHEARPRRRAGALMPVQLPDTAPHAFVGPLQKGWVRSCVNLERLVNGFLDTPHTDLPEQARALTAHLQSCPTCRESPYASVCAAMSEQVIAGVRSGRPFVRVVHQLAHMRSDEDPS